MSIYIYEWDAEVYGQCSEGNVSEQRHEWTFCRGATALHAHDMCDPHTQARRCAIQGFVLM